MMQKILKRISVVAVVVSVFVQLATGSNLAVLSKYGECVELYVRMCYAIRFVPPEFHLIHYVKSEPSFLGDGDEYLELQFSDDTFYHALLNLPSWCWKDMPLPASTQKLADGEEALLRSCYDQPISIPTIKRGKYRFLRRDHDNEYVRNYTLLMYDANTRKFYFIQYDS